MELMLALKKLFPLRLSLLISILLVPSLSWGEDAALGQLVNGAFKALDQEYQAKLAPCVARLGAVSSNNSKDDLGREDLYHTLRGLENDLTSARASGKGPCEYVDEIAELTSLLLDTSAPWNYVGAPSFSQGLDEETLKKLECGGHGTILFESLPRLFNYYGRYGRFYAPLLEYGTSQDDTPLYNLNGLISRYMCQGLVDLYSFILSRYFETRPSVRAFLNQKTFSPGDEFSLSISYSPGSTPEDGQVDIYAAVARQGMGLWFITQEGVLSRLPTPLMVQDENKASGPHRLLSFIIPQDAYSGNYTLYTVAVRHGVAVNSIENWLTDLSVLTFSIQPFSLEHLLKGLRDEPYILETKGPGEEGVKAKILHRWDLIFLGGLMDDPRTTVDESITDDLIPGEINHMMAYLGRDQAGRPIGVEMSTNLSFKGPMLRLVWFPEFGSSRPPVEDSLMQVPFFMKDLEWYNLRDARRLDQALLTRVKDLNDTLIAQIGEDTLSGLPYQLEFYWSGDLSDRVVYLIDDGRANGSSCTDYWLSLFEDFAGVCIHKARMDASSIVDYYLYDPVGSEAEVPDELNPFPFTLHVRDLFQLGFTLTDPPPHLFPCDNSTETGLPLPDRVFRSPDLVDIPAIGESTRLTGPQ